MTLPRPEPLELNQQEHDDRDENVSSTIKLSNFADLAILHLFYKMCCYSCIHKKMAVSMATSLDVNRPNF